MRQKNEFDPLNANSFTPPSYTKSENRVVINLSRKSLNNIEEEVLSLGINIAIAPSKIPVAQIIPSKEASARHLDTSSAEQLRAGVSKSLTTARPPKSNVSRQQKDALTTLKKDDSIVILLADKGNATEVLDRATYEEKMMSIVNDSTFYHRLKRDPTTRVESRVSEHIRNLHKQGLNARAIDS